MKNYILPLLLTIFLTGILSCDNGLGPSKKTDHITAHEYDSGISQNKPTATPDLDLTQKESNRWIWQKPELVIRKLGDLDNKTVVDIGAGPYGYFSFFIAGKTSAKKVIALDIDQEAIKFMQDAARKFLPDDRRDKFETRLVKANDPMLNPSEADVVLIVNTVTYFDDPVDYLTNLRRGIAEGGRLVIIDFKKRTTPIGPNLSDRIAIGELEIILKKAGYSNIEFDDRTLDYQYMVTGYR